jgi:hypothetical protein
VEDVRVREESTSHNYYYDHRTRRAPAHGSAGGYILPRGGLKGGELPARGGIPGVR